MTLCLFASCNYGEKPADPQRSAVEHPLTASTPAPVDTEGSAAEESSTASTPASVDTQGSAAEHSSAASTTASVDNEGAAAEDSSAASYTESETDNLEQIDTWIKEANGPNNDKRYDAIFELGKLKKLEDERALEPLLKATSDLWSGSGAWGALKKLKEKPAIKAYLYQIGRDPISPVRSNAIKALTELYDCREECAAILEILRDAVTDPESNIDANAIEALPKLYNGREECAEFLEFLRKALKHTNSDVQLAAIDILIKLHKIDTDDLQGNKIGTDDLQEIVEVVVKHFLGTDSSGQIFQDWDPPDTAFQILLELSSISSDPRIEKALQKAAQSRKAIFFEPAMEALGNLHQPSRETFEVLRQKADPDECDCAIRLKAISALQNLSGKADQDTHPNILETLRNTTQDINDEVRNAACQALGEWESGPSTA